MKNKNILILIIVLLTITTIAATSTAVYFGLSQNKQEETTQQENEALKQENEELKLQIQDAQVQAENNGQKNEQGYKRIFKLNGEVNVTNKSIPEANYVIERYSSSAEGVYAILGNDNTVTLAFGNADEHMSIQNYEKYSNTANVKINFGDKKVQNVYNLGAGQSASGNCILFLMEDGTVEYMPLIYAIIHEDFRSYGKLEGAENIVDITSAYANGPFEGAGSGNTVLLIQEDGTAYDIGEQLRNINSQYSIWQ